MPPKKRYRDPHADREAENYENPVPSRELILEVLNDHGKPMEFEQIASLLEVDEDGEVGLERRLKAMLRDAQLVQNRNGKLGVVSRMDLIPGRVQGHKDGFGFLIPDDKAQSDLFLGPRSFDHLQQDTRSERQASDFDSRPGRSAISRKSMSGQSVVWHDVDARGSHFSGHGR